LEPEIARDYGAYLHESVVLEAMDRRDPDAPGSNIIDIVERSQSDPDYTRLEQDLVTSLLVVTGQERKAIYFLSGHGERNINSRADDGEGYSLIKDGLEQDNYEVLPLRWRLRDEVVSVPVELDQVEIEVGGPVIEVSPVLSELEGVTDVTFLSTDGDPSDAALQARYKILVRKGHDPRDDISQAVASNGWSLLSMRTPEKCTECPPGAALLVIAGATQDLPESHIRALDLFLLGRNADGSARREAGRLLVLADPDSPDSLRVFLARWGLVAGAGYILDLDSLPQQPRIFQADPYVPQSCVGPNCPPGIPQITVPKGVELSPTLMGAAAPIAPITENFAPLAHTSANSYMIDDLDRTVPVTDGEQRDARGPFFPAIFVQTFGPVGTPLPSTQPPSNEVASLVVFGDADFIGNSFLTRPGGSPDLFLNSANFLLGDYSLVSIHPKAFAFREFNLDRNEYDFVRFSSWLFMPGLLALMAGVVWWVRR
jgi:hypothetical protein